MFLSSGFKILFFSMATIFLQNLKLGPAFALKHLNNSMPGIDEHQ